MKRRFVIFLALMILHFGVQASPPIDMDSPSVSIDVVGDDDFPPFSYRDSDGSLKGTDIEILRELQARLDIHFTIDLVPWKRLLLLTKKGKVPGSFALFDTPDRRQYALFTHPVHYSTYKLITRKDRTFTYEDLMSKENVRLGIQAGFSTLPEIERAHQEGRIELVDLYTYDDMFRRVKEGALDAVIGNEQVAKYKLSTSFKKLAPDLVIGDSVIESRGAYLVLSKQSELQDKERWQQRITQTLKEMEKDGAVTKIVDAYMEALKSAQ